MTTLKITRQTPRSYNRLIEEWLPADALDRMRAGDETAARLVSAQRRFRRTRHPEDWQAFISARNEYLSKVA